MLFRSRKKKNCMILLVMFVLLLGGIFRDTYNTSAILSASSETKRVVFSVTAEFDDHTSKNRRYAATKVERHASEQRMATTHSTSLMSSVTTTNLTCALLFFGLVKDSFKNITLPSIQTNILQQNPDCDVFVHTYNLTHVPLNDRNGETTPTRTDPTDA